MNRQRGFTTYIIAGLLLALAVTGLLLKVQSARLGVEQREHAATKAGVRAAGEAQKAFNKAKAIADNAIKARLDHENKTLRGELAVASKRLLNNAAGGGRVPQIPARPGSPDEATINVPVANRALREYFEGARRLDGETARLVIEGAQGIADLDTGKAWVKEQGK